MIRSNHINDPEDWEGKEVVLSLVIPGEGMKLEKVTLVSVTSSFILCKDTSGRDQVYTLSCLLGWEPFDESSKVLLDQQERLDTLSSFSYSEPEEEEDSGIRKVIQVPDVKR